MLGGGHRRRRIGCIGLLVALLATLAASAPAATSAATGDPAAFTWSQPFRIAIPPYVPIDYSQVASGGLQSTPQSFDIPEFDDITCPGTSRCMAVDRYHGTVVTLTEPADGGVIWPSRYQQLNHQTISISCAGTSLCAIGTFAGVVLTSTDPTSPQPTWTSAEVTDRPLRRIACPSASLCVAIDDAGNLLASTDPTGGASAWRATALAAANPPLFKLACPSATLCTAIDRFGDMFSSHDPAGGVHAWTTESMGAAHALFTLSCPSTSFCLGLDAGDHALASSNPAGGATTWRDLGSTSLFDAVEVACAIVDRCVAANGATQVASTDRASAGYESWHIATFDRAVSNFGLQLDLVACPSATRCLALSYDGWMVAGVAGAPTDAVHVTLAGTGDGTVAGTGITCPPACDGDYPRGTRVTLTATPAPGSTFAGWGGACAGTDTCEVTAAPGTAVTATFALAPPPPAFGLSVALGGEGKVVGAGIACPPSCRTISAPGSTVTLAAVPAAGWRFAGWGGECSGAGGCTVRMQADRVVGATFAHSPRAAPTGPSARIARPTIDAGHGKARFTFAAVGGHAASGPATMQCALVRRGARRSVRATTAHYRACRSPKAYAHLDRGRYVFLVRVAATGALPARRAFTLP